MTDENAEVEHEEQEAPETPEFDYEAEARKEGWVSQEEWVEAGKPADSWKPAKDFYDAGQTILPIVQAKLKREQDARRRDQEEFNKRLRRLEKTSGEALKLQREAYEKELKKQRATAIRNGDGEKVNEIDDQLEQVRSAGSEAAPEAPAIDEASQAAVRAFEAANEWYGTQEDMTLYADAAAMKIRAENPTISAEDLLNRVAARTKAAFKVQTGKRTPTVEGSTRSSSRPSKKQDYDSLPSDAKRACDEFVDSIPVAQQAEFRKRYVANYYRAEE